MFPFKASLNASTLFPFGLDAAQQIEVAARAGYEGVELWVKDIEAFVAAGGTPAALRAAGLAQAEREIAVLAELGCQAVAAPPFGDVAGTTLEEMAAHFAALSEAGRRAGVEPILEFWGRAPRLSRLSEAAYVAIESGVAGARLLLDPFHMYTGGTPVAGVGLLGGGAIGVVHVNDYPADPPRATVQDRDRRFPGEGVAPSGELAALLDRAGYRGFLSLELFVEDYGAATALDVARRGLQAMREAYDVTG